MTPSPLLILCGGQSSRMGSPKALLPYRSRPLIAHQIANAAPHRPVWLANCPTNKARSPPSPPRSPKPKRKATQGYTSYPATPSSHPKP